MFVDSEHIGLPLLGLLALRRRRPQRGAMLGHLPGRWWKRALFRLATRLGTPGRLLVHSEAQARLLRPTLGGGWELRVIPYQVDTDYWRSQASEDEPTLILAVGSEHRDYVALASAAEGLPVEVLIAAGSHWARQTAKVGEPPRNVRYLRATLSFHELRALYERASVVAVPVKDIANQSGVTTILEAMSMGRPVITSASRGQRETVRGPLVHADGSLDPVSTADRGPWLSPNGHGDAHPATGWYVPVVSPAALRAAIERLVADPALRRELGEAARASAEQTFSIERFTELLRAALIDEKRPAELREPAPAR